MAKWIELREVNMINGVANTVTVDAEKIEAFGTSVTEYKYVLIRLSGGHTFHVSNFPEDIKRRMSDAKTNT
ncbi:hypothetical protein KXQ82_19655 [Mucilaginibacter sp. HMF5004]|uniref:hypothetical protein n=1 Tax=Mucilaginibacter rivuli TaxID=2857527 RepID=UPI001C5DE68E|nr:hypothetical protein [Mucilaginibacter rivuli]MBW4891950.1 hypothetical protein [Mucilaginibacter rivuli]